MSGRTLLSSQYLVAFTVEVIFVCMNLDVFCVVVMCVHIDSMYAQLEPEECGLHTSVAPCI